MKIGDRIVVLYSEEGWELKRKIYDYGYRGKIIGMDAYPRILVQFDLYCEYGEQNKWYADVDKMIPEELFDTPLAKAIYEP